MMTRTGKCRWTIEEDDIIRKNCDCTDIDIGIMLGRTAKAVEMRRYRLKNKWENEKDVEEEKILKEITELMSPDYMSPNYGQKVADYLLGKEVEEEKQFKKITELSFVKALDKRVKALEEEVRNMSHQIYYDNIKRNDNYNNLVDKISEYFELIKTDMNDEANKSKVEETDPVLDEMETDIKLFDSIKKFFYDYTHWQQVVALLIIMIAVTPFKPAIAMGLITGGIISMYMLSPFICWWIDRKKK